MTISAPNILTKANTGLSHLFTADQYRIHAFVILFIGGLSLGLLIAPSGKQTNDSVNGQDIIIAEKKKEIAPAVSEAPLKTSTAKEIIVAEGPIVPAPVTSPNDSLDQTRDDVQKDETVSIAEVIPSDTIIEATLKRGSTLNQLLINNGANNQDAYLIQRAIGKHFDMRKLQIGQKFQFTVDSDNAIQKIQMEKNFNSLITVHRTDKKDGHSYKGEIEEIPTEIITRHAKGRIDGSLFLAAQKQGIPQGIIAELIRVFSFEVDFQREIRAGDGFELLYEREITVDGTKAREGNILFAQMTLRGKPLALYRFKPTDSKMTDYFHVNGQSSKRMLMKTPIKGARLSSYYGKRKHPVLGYTRMHKGLDFGAPTGTPIMAAGNGIIEKSRRFGSYGNYVRIRHNKTYKTAYAHLSRYGKGIKEGRRVKQGQIIGYVGATGRVTARHLHYEVLKNGVQINPLNIKIPTGRILGGKQRKLFRQAMKKIDGSIATTLANSLAKLEKPLNSNPTVVYTNNPTAVGK